MALFDTPIFGVKNDPFLDTPLEAPLLKKQPTDVSHQLIPTPKNAKMVKFVHPPKPPFPLERGYLRKWNGVFIGVTSKIEEPLEK